MGRHEMVKAIDRKVIGLSLAAWVVATTFGSFWAFSRVEDKLQDESDSISLLSEMPGASIEWNGRDGYLRVPVGTDDVDDLVSELSDIRGARNIEVEYVESSAKGQQQ